MRTRHRTEGTPRGVACVAIVVFGFLLGGPRWTGVRNEEVLAAEGSMAQVGSNKTGISWQDPSVRAWKPHILFDDPKVIELCYAIANRDYDRIDRLVKQDGVDINSRGYQDITPMLWVFALFWPEAAQNIPDLRGVSGEEYNRKLIAAQERILAEYSQLFEHLMKLGADPNAKLSKRPPKTSGRLWVFSPIAFDMEEGLALTHISTRHYLGARYSFFRTVMAGGGDPNLVYDYRGVTPIFLVCNNGRYLPSLVYIPPSDPKNLALLIDAHVDLEFRDPQEWAGRPKNSTPILAAAEAEHFDLVYMLIYAGADFRATNERGWGLAKYAADYLRSVQELPQEQVRPGVPHKVEAYYLDVVRFLEDKGVVAEGTHGDYKVQTDRVVEESDIVVYSERDPFVDQWAAKRRGLQESPEANTTDPKAKAPE